MEWALVCVIAFLIVALISSSLVFLRIVRETFSTLDRERVRHNQMIGDMTDRFMASSMAEYKGWKSVEPIPEPVGGDEVDDDSGFKMPDLEEIAAGRPWGDIALMRDVDEDS